MSVTLIIFEILDGYIDSIDDDILLNTFLNSDYFITISKRLSYEYILIQPELLETYFKSLIILLALIYISWIIPKFSVLISKIALLDANILWNTQFKHVKIDAVIWPNPPIFVILKV